jgi:hypothetical protein
MDRKQMDELQGLLEADIAAALRRGGVPLLDGASQPHAEVRPVLVVDLLWSRPCSRDDWFVLTTRTDLLEPARPLSDSSRIVWPVSWGSSSQQGVAASELAGRVVSRADQRQ